MRLRKSASATGQSLRRLTPLTLWLKWGGCMRPRGMWGWCLVCCGKIQYKGKYNWKFICNILSILMEGDRCTGNLPPAEVLPKERLAQRFRYCRIMPMKRRNAPPRTAGQGLYFLLVLCRFICLRLTVVLHCRIHICIRILRLSENSIT